MPGFHFISGLPRSGSTLLAAILLQNPRFHAGMSSPVGGLFSSVREHCSAGSEFAPLITHEQRRNLLRGLFDSYYADQADKSVVFDTNRLWCANLPALRELFPQSKVIACVRNVAWIMDSLERLFRANPFENTKLFADASERNSVYSRVETLAQRNRLVGFAWSALKEAYYGEQADSLLVIDYDLLVQNPEQVIRLVYQFIDALVRTRLRQPVLRRPGLRRIPGRGRLAPCASAGGPARAAHAAAAGPVRTVQQAFLLGRRQRQCSQRHSHQEQLNNIAGLRVAGAKGYMPCNG
ncbi:sulfotransferase family protein [Pseudomonas knackmussii B13]|uniref:Sulfotransferase family protein n=1 Tax=Pseudomonas knackmussii (strain DSM 6978 / CCUG 54928 / LMG 23759 / B13) TaxID=1301098 RepID=A0A024HIJ0_PSEKB|nr:sulfotransferase family protein [Pseudomonas knackmussii B13]